VIALVLAAVTAATPQPWPTPLKTIATVRSSTLCTTLRENVFGAVEGLRSNDALAEQGHALLRSSVYRGMTPMDEMRLENMGMGMVHNIERIDALLADSHRFTGDLQKAKAQLQAVEDEQKKSLNLMYGVADTMAMNDLANAGDRNMMRAAGADVARSFPTPAPTPDALPSPGAGESSGFANNPWSDLAGILDAYRAQTAAAETPAIQTLDDLVTRCR
jgi:hypothetical protein